MSQITEVDDKIKNMLEKIISLLKNTKFKCSTEKELQLGIANMFEEQGIIFKREYKLSPTDTIDFLIGDIGLEVKIKGGSLDVSRQLLRYAQSDKVIALILFTTKQLIIPEELNGKKVYKIWKIRI